MCHAPLPFATTRAACNVALGESCDTTGALVVTLSSSTGTAFSPRSTGPASFTGSFTSGLLDSWCVGGVWDGLVRSTWCGSATRTCTGSWTGWRVGGECVGSWAYMDSWQGRGLGRQHSKLVRALAASAGACPRSDGAPARPLSSRMLPHAATASANALDALRNKFCFTGGYLEARIKLPGNLNVRGEAMLDLQANSTPRRGPIVTITRAAATTRLGSV